MTASNISLYGFIAISIILLGFAAVVLGKMATDKIGLNDLLAEPPPPGESAEQSKASLSRFQFLIFTFVIAGLYLLLSIEAGTFVEIPTNVLGLLGISGGSYVVSKWVGSGQKPDEGTGAEKSKPARSRT